LDCGVQKGKGRGERGRRKGEERLIFVAILRKAFIRSGLVGREKSLLLYFVAKGRGKRGRTEEGERNVTRMNRGMPRGGEGPRSIIFLFGGRRGGKRKKGRGGVVLVY